MKFPRNKLFQRIAIALAATIIIVYVYPHPENKRFNYEEGRPWNYAQLFAPFDIPVYPDSATVQRARDTLDARFIPIFELNQLVIDTIVRALPDAGSHRLKTTLASELRKIYSGGVVDSETREMIEAGRLPKIRILEKNIINEMPTRSFTSPREIYLYLDSTITDPALHDYFSKAGLHEILEPNYTLNREKSEQLYDNEYELITARRGVILSGATIINKGDIITPQDFTNLRTYEAMLDEMHTNDKADDVVMLLGQFGYVALILAALMLYFYFYAPEIYEKRNAVLFIYAMITVFFLLAAGSNRFISSGIYIVPMTIIPVLMLVFFEGRTAFFVAMSATLICAGISSFALEFIFLQYCASAVAIYSLRELSRRAQLLRTSLVVAVTYIVAYASLELMMNGTFDDFNLRMVVFLLINAALTSMAYILMSAVERMFGFVSVVTLVELADINNPLLLRLSNECPGTFQHSIAVSNLASDAAQRIGANVQLIRAGALYHDIGKLKNPAFFTENQHGVNPHDALPPERSASIVIDHVADGLRLADKAGLPEVIRNFISEHHGAGMAKYFYYTYCAKNPDADPTPFRYPGPNPQTRETSLMMMADCVEAASRSLTDHSQAAITDLVNKIIDGQIADGLHNQSTLTFRDIPRIKEAFIKRLSTIYHSRVAYPSAPAAQ